ncbi:MAG: hypothetical protein MJZ66_04450 [Bacteroidales bacterium]|nr:hypothetical protein [Bacteroidales bacterium]
MKKLFIPAVLCCALMACGGAKTNSESADSKTDASATEVNYEPKKAEDPYTMVDGKIFELKGNVKKCVVSEFYSDANGNPTGTKPEEETTMEFGADGKISKHSGYEKLVRNSNDKLEKMTWYCSDFGFDFEDQFTCNEAGFLVSEKIRGLGGITWTYELDDQNERVKAVSEAIYEEGYEGKNETTLKVLERDDKGNWTKRLLNVKDGQREMGTTDYEWNIYNWVQIRKIEY